MENLYKGCYYIDMKNFINEVVKYFDKLEDKVRMRISKYPITFALVGGFAIVEFWRGIWQITDYALFKWFELPADGVWSNVISIIVGTVIILMTGLYVSLFISDDVLVSGIKKDRKEFEKVIEKIQKEESRAITQVAEIKNATKNICEVGVDLVALRKEIAELKELVKNK